MRETHYFFKKSLNCFVKCKRLIKMTGRFPRYEVYLKWHSYSHLLESFLIIFQKAIYFQMLKHAYQ